MDIMYILLPLAILLGLQFITQLQLTESLYQVQLQNDFLLYSPKFINTTLQTIHQCIELCVFYKLCRSISYSKESKECLLMSDDYNRQRAWKNYDYSGFTAINKISIPSDIGGSCRGHNCAIDEMCMPTGQNMYTCVTHEYNTVKCAEGWGHVEKSDICFNVFYDRKTWLDAKDYCTSFGGEFLMLESENAYLNYFRMRIRLLLMNDVSPTLAGHVWTGMQYSASMPPWINMKYNSTSGPKLCLGIMYNKTDPTVEMMESWEVVSCDDKNVFACQHRAPDYWQ